MSKKKENHKAKSGDERAKELIKNLSQYEDFNETFLNNIPYSFPRTFRLKIGPEPVGLAVIDWKAVVTRFIGLAALMAQTDDTSADEHLQQLNDALPSMSFEEKVNFMLPYLTCTFHMLEFLPQKLNDAMIQLCAEARHNLVIRTQQKLGSDTIPSASQFAEWVAKFEKEATKKRLPEVRGGNKKTKPAWRNKDTLRAYAQRVNDRKLLAVCIKDMYEKCEGEDSWIEDLKQDSNFRLLSSSVPDEVIAWAERRIASEDMPAREREPLSIACEISRRELDLPEQDIETLRTYYTEGNKLLKEDRNKRS